MNQDSSLIGRSILVTGGSRGIGREITLGLVEAGADVAVLARTESPQLLETMKRAAALMNGGRATAIVADVRRQQDCTRAVDQVIDVFGGVDVLINNAGVPKTDEGAPFWRVSSKDWLRTVETNINGVFFVTQCCAPHMIARRCGKIINISSSDSMMVRKNSSPYGPSKAFLEAASRMWADELADSGITVNVLHPGGGVDTLADVTGRPSGDRKYVPGSVMRAPILWLASDASNGISGQKFTATKWDDNLPLPARIERARESGHASPKIM